MILPSEHGGVSAPCKKEKKTSSATTILRRSSRRNFLCVASLFFLCILCGFVSGLIAADHGLDYLSPFCDSPLAPNQCLLEDWNITKEICNLPGDERQSKMQETRLKFCSLYSLDSVISNKAKSKCIIQGSYNDCVTYLNRIQNLDESVCKKNSLFLNIVSRFDCKEQYSIMWSCTNCVKAYREWLCAVYIPFYVNGILVKPCNAFCSKVEETCPFFRPAIKETYAGDPSFICKDPYIHNQIEHIEVLHEGNGDLYDESEVSEHCYRHCHLESLQGLLRGPASACDNAPTQENDIDCPELRPSETSGNMSTTNTTSGSVNSVFVHSTSNFWYNLVEYVRIFWLLQTLFQYLSAGLT